MRRLALELYGPELRKRIDLSVYRNIKSLELLHVLRRDREEFAGIWRIELKNPKYGIVRIFNQDNLARQIQILEREKSGSYTLFMRRAPRTEFFLDQDISMQGGGYQIGTFDYRDGRIKLEFVGNQRYLKKILSQIDRSKLEYKVTSVGAPTFSSKSLLSSLTEKQRSIICLAFRLGYYNTPRCINSEELANRLSLKRATVVEHLRKANFQVLFTVMEAGRIR